MPLAAHSPRVLGASTGCRDRRRAAAPHADKGKVANGRSASQPPLGQSPTTAPRLTSLSLGRHRYRAGICVRGIERHANHHRTAAAPAVLHVLLIACRAVHGCFSRLPTPRTAEGDGLNRVHRDGLLRFAVRVGQASDISAAPDWEGQSRAEKSPVYAFVGRFDRRTQCGVGHPKADGIRGRRRSGCVRAFIRLP